MGSVTGTLQIALKESMPEETSLESAPINDLTEENEETLQEMRLWLKEHPFIRNCRTGIQILYFIENLSYYTFHN